MSPTARKKNLVGAFVSLTAILLIFIGSTVSEGNYLCVSKTLLLAVGTSLWPLYRVVGEFVGRDRDGHQS